MNEAAVRRDDPPYRLYALILGLIVGVRALDLATRNMSWTYAIYRSGAWWFALSVLAIVLGFVAAPYLRARMPTAMVWLLCGLLGGALTILTSSTIGIACGVVGASFSIFESTRKRVVEYLLKTVLPTSGVSLLAGSMAALAYVNLGQASVSHELLTTLGPLLAGLVVLIVVLRRTSRERRVVGWLGAFLLFIGATVLGFAFTMLGDLFHRDQAMVHVRSNTTGISWLNNFGSTRTSRDIGRKIDRAISPFMRNHLAFEAGSSSQDMPYAAGFPHLNSIAIAHGSQITDKDFAKLNARYVSSFSCVGQTQLTDLSIQRLDKSKLQHLTLDCPNFTDAALQQLSNAPTLYYISVNNSRITSAPFQNIDPRAPLYGIEAANTPVDDSIISSVCKLPFLQFLVLRGTKVTGSTLKSLRGKSISLDLSDTLFDQRFLKDLLPPPGAKGTPLNQVTVKALQLGNAKLSAESFALISQFPQCRDLDISGSEVSLASLALIVKMPSLNSLALDAETLTEAAFALLHTSLNLTPVYDANVMTAAEICESAVALHDERYARVGVDGAMNLLIRNMTLTTAAVRELTEGTTDFSGIILRNAKLPDGTTRSFSYIGEAIDFLKSIQDN